MTTLCRFDFDFLQSCCKMVKGPRVINVYPHKDPLVGMGVTLIAGGSVSDLRLCWLKHLCPQVVEFLFINLAISGMQQDEVASYAMRWTCQATTKSGAEQMWD